MCGIKKPPTLLFDLHTRGIIIWGSFRRAWIKLLISSVDSSDLRLAAYNDHEEANELSATSNVESLKFWHAGRRDSHYLSPRCTFRLPAISTLLHWILPWWHVFPKSWSQKRVRNSSSDTHFALEWLYQFLLDHPTRRPSEPNVSEKYM